MAVDLLSRILYRDGLIIILDKPAGLPVHQGPSGGPSLEDDFAQLRFGLPRLPALAHRLDADTSGCLVLGRHPKALRRLGKIFREGRAEKTYLALTCGVPEQEQGRIDAPLFKQTRPHKGWRMTVDASGKPALTAYRVLAARGDVALLVLHPRTGRTHQIRVHLAHIGCPILGDTKYGAGASDAGARLHLHAARIRLPLYAKRAPVDVQAPLPPHFVSTLRQVGLPDPS
ncbi:MAG: RNA pseudouridine synthase [Alphaproteobacteria bacterium]|nr:MAG: RNA pseudouridine synthase [Alphaproteobacteria bacterium]